MRTDVWQLDIGMVSPMRMMSWQEMSFAEE